MSDLFYVLVSFLPLSIYLAIQTPMNFNFKAGPNKKLVRGTGG